MKSLARELRFRIFYFQILREVSHENLFLRDRGCKTCCERVSEDGWGSLSGGRFWDGFGTVSAMFGSWSDRLRSGTNSSGVFLLTFLCVVLVCFATHSLQTAVERTLQVLFFCATQSLPIAS